jgi:putative transposase
MTTILTYKYRLYPSPEQEKSMFRMLAVARNWYNYCLMERTLAWETEKRSIGKYAQNANVKYWRKSIPFARQFSSQSLALVCKDVDEAFQAFFRRVKAGETPGYPKFKGYKFFNSVGFPAIGNGCRIDGRRFYMLGVGRIRMFWHRPIEGTPKTARVSYNAGQWFVSITCEVIPPKPLEQTGKQLGIDVGIHHLMATSDGEFIENPHWFREAQVKLRILQRKVERCEKRSNNQKALRMQVARMHGHIKNQREDFIDKLVYRLTKDYDVIALEDLRIKNMVKNPHLSKSILDAGWGYFGTRLEQKASFTGCIIKWVDPRNTSKTCSGCGYIFENLRLSDRWVTCPDCGLSLDRDHNAALNVLNRAGDARER